QLAQLVRGVADGGLGADDVLFAGRDRRLALDQLERRHRPDVDLDLVALVELLGEAEALLGDLELIARRDQVPVGDRHLLDGVDHLALELALRSRAVGARDPDAALDGVAAEVAQEGLDGAQAQERVVARVERVEDDVALLAGVVEIQGEVGAGRHVAVEAEVERLLLEARGRDLRDLGRRVVERRQLAGQVQVVDAAALEDAEPGLAAHEALDAEPQVVLEGEADRLVESELDLAVDDRQLGRRRRPGSCRRDGHRRARGRGESEQCEAEQEAADNLRMHHRTPRFAWELGRSGREPADLPAFSSLTDQPAKCSRREQAYPTPLSRPSDSLLTLLPGALPVPPPQAVPGAAPASRAGSCGGMRAFSGQGAATAGPSDPAEAATRYRPSARSE